MDWYDLEGWIMHCSVYLVTLRVELWELFYVVVFKFGMPGWAVPSHLANSSLCLSL